MMQIERINPHPQGSVNSAQTTARVLQYYVVHKRSIPDEYQGYVFQFCRAPSPGASVCFFKIMFGSLSVYL